MPHARAIGARAEVFVAQWLAERGWTIVATNVRVGRDEIDIVARDRGTLVFVEVRMRAVDASEHPFETITAAKAKRLRRAALRYAAKMDHVELRIDVAAVTGATIELLENAIDFTTT